MDRVPAKVREQTEKEDKETGGAKCHDLQQFLSVALDTQTVTRRNVPFNHLKPS